MNATLTLKIDTLYAACSPELGLVSYGRCEDEAINNLTDELRAHQSFQERFTGYEKMSHVIR
jgi:hypothetical protein